MQLFTALFEQGCIDGVMIPVKVGGISDVLQWFSSSLDAANAAAVLPMAGSSYVSNYIAAKTSAQPSWHL